MDATWTSLLNIPDGAAPYLRGPYAGMYARQPWTLRPELRGGVGWATGGGEANSRAAGVETLMRTLLRRNGTPRAGARPKIHLAKNVTCCGTRAGSTGTRQLRRLPRASS